ncbi:unnamed protein product [Cylicocyclus nassatus]|uniref:Glycosyltransferase 2-like domain-containing protein n=1 Tax=Cylicocyclus nassatus TaxID=53992 RepID=A0AA36GNR7_CYLNA|nr:unnamed protein product [Cylicocyclus nassatus]
MDVSVVIPVKNGMPYLKECLESLLQQNFDGKWEICMYNDGSTDSTITYAESFIPQFQERNIDLRIRSGAESGGVGFAKNQAVKMSTGRFICFCDADDVSELSRLQEQYNMAISRKSDLVFIGSNFTRLPEGSTERYTKWANELTTAQLTVQVYTSHGPTLIAPTWFISRKLFFVVGGFRDDLRSGFPEDLDFFYRALDVDDVAFAKVYEPLVKYRYHPGCASFGVSEAAIWNMRVSRFCSHVLPFWKTFTIWNAGKQGKRFFKSLSESDKQRVVSFCDVDVKKIKRAWLEDYDEKARVVRWKLPIVHVKSARPPVVICVKLDMTGGDLERLVAESQWEEGRDYVYFS